MTLLLDTHTFIWWDSDPAKLPSEVLRACQDQTNTILLSVASVWEMQIKSQMNKLRFDLSLAEIVRGQQEVNKVQILPVTLEHVLALQDLPTYHKDPFDRLLIAQANVEDAVLVSCDSIFFQYSVRLLW